MTAPLKTLHDSICKDWPICLFKVSWHSKSSCNWTKLCTALVKDQTALLSKSLKIDVTIRSLNYNHWLITV